jgi:ATP-dependent Clp protease ATP-binding subunit ClpB
MDRLVPENLVSRLNTLGDYLRSNILGQDEVLGDIVALLRRGFCKFRFPSRPIASMLFLGPTGVGKTETCNLLTRYLFGSDDKLIRLDMSEYQEQRSIGILLGANLGERGLLGHYYDIAGGSGVLLLDEIEKAHRLILDLLLQMLSAARIKLATGESLDLRGFVVVGTSNMGSRVLMESRSTDRETLVRRTLRTAMDIMRPEIYRRFQLKCVFNKLDFETLKRIGQLHLEKSLTLINGEGHSVECASGILEHVQRSGYTEEFGAGPMEEAALEILGNVVADETLRNGGRPVHGVIGYDRRTNRCFLTKEAAK